MCLVFSTQTLTAGPPFDTDDPQPVDLFHWEFYIASVYEFSGNNENATLPHIEVNYGAVRNMQIHILTGMGYVKEDSHHQYGFMTAELGVKYRFVNAENGLQIGVFPLIELPTSRKVDLVGNNNLQLFLPLWIQKDFGKFSTYGGGGLWINPGGNNKNWLFAGYQGQYNFSETLTLGGELYFKSADAEGADSDFSIKLGGYININEGNHILFSIGHSLKNKDLLTGYMGYQWTL